MKAATLAPAARARPQLAVGLALLAVYLIWGSTYLAIRVAVESVPPFLMAGFRFLLAGGAMYLFLRARGTPAPSRAQWGAGALVGALLLLFGNGFVSFAEQSVSSGLAAVGVATVPLWAALFAGLWGHWPRRGEWLGLAVGFAGVLLLNLGGDLRANALGAGALLIASISWALGTVWSARLPLPAGPMASAVEMLMGGALLLGAGFATGEVIPAAAPPAALLAIAYLVGIGSIVGFSAYGYLLQHVSPVVSTSYAYVNPAVAVALGALLLGEQVTGPSLLAMALILAGVVLVTMGRAHSTAVAKS